MICKLLQGEQFSVSRTELGWAGGVGDLGSSTPQRERGESWGRSET